MQMFVKSLLLLEYLILFDYGSHYAYFYGYLKIQMFNITSGGPIDQTV